MRNLEMERVTLAAQSVGIAKRCLEVMNAYAGERVAFGQPINRFGQIQRLIAESYAQFQAGRSFLYNVSGHLDLFKPGNRVDTDAVKLFCGPMGKEVADNAIQVLGGYGYVGEGVVERLWRDAKLLEIGGGTNEAHQKNITKDLARSGFSLLWTVCCIMEEWMAVAQEGIVEVATVLSCLSSCLFFGRIEI